MDPVPGAQITVYKQNGHFHAECCGVTGAQEPRLSDALDSLAACMYKRRTILQALTVDMLTPKAIEQCAQLTHLLGTL